ncbi:Phosphatidylinositol transfer protein sfh5 [Penicillium diatomitis]|uniref:Phosphatidylinositol transfer protein SFH5 n=1 Tax=Penicillium diatomitis TaxID=2819901 RepID=A0A9W9XLS4_9EURO|nr:Phosphatidylinositol transfer protein sfh5 [Penicillium diatomitis]KAJ5495238.1 Phosphatidylinositol transfer protein sfh5 [Penicillium diatomitis]
MADLNTTEQAPAAELVKRDEAVALAPEVLPASDQSAAAPAAAPTETVTPTEAEPQVVQPTEETPVEHCETVNDAAALPAAAAINPAAHVPDGATPQEPSVEEQPEYLTKIAGLTQFFEQLPQILTETGHQEMWGVVLKNHEDVPTVNVLIKFLRANEGNVQAAQDQLRKALEWRKEINPIALVESGRYSAAKYDGLGYLTTYEQDGRPLVFTWNIYGAVKDVKKTFGDSNEFVKWRAALMEMAVQDLKMKDATEVIDYDGKKDHYQMIQVHDYLHVKFLRMDPVVRAATKQTIEVFSTAYPELLREKFFVNVPSIMGWMFSAMKLFLSRNTTRKFHPIANGANLAREFPSAIGDQIPKTYGGKGAELREGARTVQLVEDEVEPEAAQSESQPTQASSDVVAPAVPEKVEQPVAEEATAPVSAQPAMPEVLTKDAAVTEEEKPVSEVAK